MKYMFMGVICFIVGLLASPLGYAQETVHLATLNWEPYAGQRLKNYGFTSEIISTAFKKAGYRVEYTFLPWMRGLKETAMGKHQGLTCAYYSEERNKRFNISKSYANSILGFGKRIDVAIKFNNLMDLKPYTIGVVRGYVNTQAFDAADYLTKNQATDDFMNVRKLNRGRVDLVFIDKYVLQYIVATKYPVALGKLTFMEPPLEVKPLHILFSKKTAQKLVDDFNRELDTMHDDGTIDTIMAAHGFED